MNFSLDLDDTRDYLDPEHVLRCINYEKSKPKHFGKELRDFCPIHRGDNQRSLSINKETRVFFCHSCGAKGNLSHLYELANKNSPDKKETLQKISDKDLHLSISLAQRIWEKSRPCEKHGYFSKKGVACPPNIREYVDIQGNICAVIPYYNVNHVLQALQYVSEKGKFNGYKNKMGGSFFLLGQLDNSPDVYVCEGIATACSIWEGVNKKKPVLSCGSIWNIPKVIYAVKEKYPGIEIHVCLEKDHTAEKLIKSVLKIGYNHVVFHQPQFLPQDLKEGVNKDFNDLHQLYSVESVARQLQQVYQINSESKASKKFELQSVAEISSDYFTVPPKEKEALLYCIEKDGGKIPFLHKEIVGMLVAEGGRGKTFLLTLLASCVVTGIPWLQEFIIDRPGAVALIVGENDHDDVHRLLFKINKHLKNILKTNMTLPSHERFVHHFQNPLEKMLHNLFVLSVHGVEAAFVDDLGKKTAFYGNVIEQLKTKEPDEGWRLIILDPASRFLGPEAEKDNAIATAFIASLEGISRDLIGKPTVLLSHHKSKAATKETSAGQFDARGSSALTDGVRWQANLVKSSENEDLFFLEVTKTNFTKIPQKFRIKKNKDGIPVFDGFHISHSEKVCSKQRTNFRFGADS